MDIRLSTTIVKFDGWPNRIVTLRLESKKLNGIFCQYFPTDTYIGIIANQEASI